MSEVHRDFAAILHRSAALWRTTLDERLRPRGMSYTTWRTLWILRTAEASYNQRSLAERLGIETPTLVRILDRMESLGLLKRTADSHDRRQKHIEIMPAGLKLSEEIEGEVVAVRNRMLAGIKASELQIGITLLERILKNGADTEP